MAPLVSVIIPTYNRGATLLRAVNSVFKQNYPNLELIIIDDGSTDNSQELLKNNFFDHKLKYVFQKNKGVSSARNKGLELATGEYIAFLDSDDEWLANKLSKQISYLQKNNFKIVQSEEIWFRNNKQVNKPLKYKKEEGYLFEKSLLLCAITPSSSLLCKTLIEEIGFFDTNLKAAEDYDYWLKISAKYPIGLVNENLIIKYGGHQDQLSQKYFLDFFRLQALQNLLLNNKLTAPQRHLTEIELIKRKAIYENGLKKRKAIGG